MWRRFGTVSLGVLVALAGCDQSIDVQTSTAATTYASNLGSVIVATVYNSGARTLTADVTDPSGRELGTVKLDLGAATYTVSIQGVNTVAPADQPDNPNDTTFPAWIAQHGIDDISVGAFNSVAGGLIARSYGLAPPADDGDPTDRLSSGPHPLSYMPPDPKCPWPFDGDGKCSGAGTKQTWGGADISGKCCAGGATSHDACYAECPESVPVGGGSTKSCNPKCIKDCNHKLGQCAYDAVLTACTNKGGGAVKCVAEAKAARDYYDVGTDLFGGDGCNSCGHSRGNKFCEKALGLDDGSHSCETDVCLCNRCKALNPKLYGSRDCEKECSEYGVGHVPKPGEGTIQGCNY